MDVVYITMSLFIYLLSIGSISLEKPYIPIKVKMTYGNKNIIGAGNIYGNMDD